MSTAPTRAPQAPLTPLAPLRVAVLASGGGSNLGALLAAQHDLGDACEYEVALVVSDRPNAGALTRAREAGVPACTIAVSARPEAEVAADLTAALTEAAIDLVALAGYLRLVPAAVVNRWAGRMLNVHPALLPAFGGPGMWGRHVHEAVLAAGARISGPTVHLVDERYDEGRIIAQWPVAVASADTAQTLADRVLRAEHALYPLVLRHAARALRGGLAIAPLELNPDAVPLPSPDTLHLSPKGLAQ